MEQYCAGWSYPGGLCTPELIKLISNCYLVLFAAVLWLLSFRKASTKRLVRFWLDTAFIHFEFLFHRNIYDYYFPT